MPIITLLSDFGLRDAYVGQMKGVMVGIVPDARLIDLTHAIPPQNVVAGALALDAAVGAFPDGSVHLAVVDPGVGTERQAVAVVTQRFALVGPDNGLFDLVLKRYRATACVRLPSPTDASQTFHGRDVFAPAAARLAGGADVRELGEQTELQVSLDLPQPVERGETLEVHVLDVDHFGNLITDATVKRVTEWAGDLTGRLEIAAGGVRFRGLHRTFGDVAEGEPVAYIGSSGRLEVAVRNGSASRVLGVGAGAMFTIRRASGG